MRNVIFYVHDGFADWEASYILPILKSHHVDIHVVSNDARSVRSAGGLCIDPDGSLDNFMEFNADGLILPGGSFWISLSPSHPIFDLILRMDRHSKLIAGICASTIALARKGLLNDRRHTSNDMHFLKAEAPEYNGEKFYHKDLAITDGHLITASGIGALEFTLEILSYFKIFDERKREEWYQLFKNALMPPQAFS